MNPLADYDFSEYNAHASGMNPYQWGRMQGVQGLALHYSGDHHNAAQAAEDVTPKHPYTAQWRMLRNGEVVQMTPEDAAVQHIQPARMYGARFPDADNGHWHGIEVEARSDKDLSDEQRGALPQWARRHAQQYGYDPSQNIAGHSELNPGHRTNEMAGYAQAIRSGGSAPFTPTPTADQPQVANAEPPATTPTTQPPTQQSNPAVREALDSEIKSLRTAAMAKPAEPASSAAPHASPFGEQRDQRNPYSLHNMALAEANNETNAYVNQRAMLPQLMAGTPFKSPFVADQGGGPYG